MRIFATVMCLWTILSTSDVVRAERPDEGGLFSFDETDVVDSWDEPQGRIRVHYSVEGPNATRDEDLDSNGVPDFAEDVATTAADVLGFYKDILGFRSPLAEADLSLGPLGGSEAFDAYLVDFARSSDGNFGVDACTQSPYVCAGYLSMENDFVGYGYPSLQTAIDILTSHELFHGVQNAYHSGMPGWLSEGTAVWAERQFSPAIKEFLRFASDYLADSGRSINRPPVGPVPTFSYSTCLFWDFLSLRHSSAVMVDFFAALAEVDQSSPDSLLVLNDVLASAPDSLTEVWTEFVRWNLATGPRAGEALSYEYAASLGGVLAEAEGPVIDDDNRFYPLAATYYRIEHAGGPLWFGLAEAAPALRFGLHPVLDGSSDGAVGEAVDQWTGEQQGSFALAGGVDLPAGGYWLWGTYPELATESIKVRICLGDSIAVLNCGDPVEVEPEPPMPDDGGGCDLRSGGPGNALTILFGILLALLSTRRFAH